MVASAGALLENAVCEKPSGLPRFLKQVIVLLLGGEVGTILEALFVPLLTLDQVF